MIFWLRCDSKNSLNFFFYHHNFAGSRFGFTLDPDVLAYSLFSFFIKLRTSTFSLKGSTLQLLFGLNCHHQYSNALKQLKSKDILLVHKHRDSVLVEDIVAVIAVE